MPNADCLPQGLRATRRNTYPISPILPRERRSERGNQPMFQGLSVFVLVLLALVVITIFQGIRIVPQGYNYTVERFGRYIRTLTPGLGLIIPFIDRIGSKLNMMERVLEVPSQEVITRDNAMVEVDGIAFFQVLDAAKATYEVNELENAVRNLTSEERRVGKEYGR